MKKLSVMAKKKVAINRGTAKKIIDEMESNGIDTAAEYFFAALDGFIANEKDPVAKKAYTNYMLIFSRASQEADRLVGSQSNKVMGDVHALSGILDD